VQSLAIETEPVDHLELLQPGKENVAMRERLRRSVLVDAPLEVAWNYLSNPEQWPQTWAGHIRQVECDPPGAVTARTQGVLQMKEGFKSRLTMTEFRPGQDWERSPWANACFRSSV
jgi:hypothetical protein